MPEIAETQETVEEVGTDANGFEPITSQEDLDRIIQKRLAREREKFADYDELSAAAARAKQVEADSQKLVAEATERADKAVAEADKARLERDRLSVAVEFGLPEEAREFLTATDLDGLKEQAEKLSALAPKSKNTLPGWAHGAQPTERPKSSGEAFDRWVRRQGLV